MNMNSIHRAIANQEGCFLSDLFTHLRFSLVPRQAQQIQLVVFHDINNSWHATCIRYG